MTYVTWEGRVRGRAIGWKIVPSKASQALFIIVDLEAWESYGDGKWSDLPAPPYRQNSRITIQHKDGRLYAERCEEVMEALGWDGSGMSIDKSPEINIPCQWNSKASKKNAQTFFNGEFLKPFHAIPQGGSKLEPAPKSLVSAFDDKFGSQLRAIAAGMKPKDNPAPTPPPVENPDADPPPEYGTITDPPAKPQEYGGSALPEETAPGNDQDKDPF